jgi:hypothetical protein
MQEDNQFDGLLSNHDIENKENMGMIFQIKQMEENGKN